MKNRPLFCGCLILFLILSLCNYVKGAKFVKELRPSILEKQMNEGDDIRLSGQVYEINNEESYQRIYLKNNSITNQNNSFEEPRIIIYDKEKLNIEIGNRLFVAGNLSFFEKERNPGGFNQKLYYQKQNIHVSVWADKIKIIDDRTWKWRNRLYHLRCQWNEKLFERMGKENGAILSAMLLAEKSGMEEETKELYQVNGVAHVLAISGLHLSIIGIGLYQIFRRLSGSFVVGGMMGIVFLLLYILMIGMSVSVLRAFIMFLFRVGADMTGRHYDSLTAVAAALLVTILWQPLCIYDGGFWLSYGAILGILLILPVFEGMTCQGLWASISINIMTLPVLFYYFFEVPLYATFLNLMIVPLMTVILISGLSGSICCGIFVSDGPFGEEGIGGILLWICKGIFWFYEKICKVFLELPSARFVVGRPEMWKILFYYSCLILVLLLWKKEKRILVAGGIMIFAIFTLIYPVQHKNEVMITMLDVGQGDGIFVRGPMGKTYLIDGGSSDLKNISKYQLEPFLKSQGVKELDYVFVSHGDKDHISGIMEMIERMKVGIAIKTLVLPEKSVWDEELSKLAVLAIHNDILVVTISSGQCLNEKDMKFTCLAPVKELANSHYADSNSGSMVLALKYRKFDMLFTGDVEAEGEEILTEVLKNEYKEKRWEVLKVAHHGSKNSTSDLFLEAITPAYAVISAGRENSYGHPHAETLERLACAGSRVFSTQENGAISIVTDGEMMRVEGYLKEER